jgi:hypothetical protein
LAVAGPTSSIASATRNRSKLTLRARSSSSNSLEVDELGQLLRPERVDVEGAASDQGLEAADELGRTLETVRAAVISTLLHGRGVASRAVRRCSEVVTPAPGDAGPRFAVVVHQRSGHLGLPAGGRATLGRLRDRRDLRDHIARTADEHAVARLEPDALDVGDVVQRRVAHDDAEDLDRLEVRTRRQAPVRTHLQLDRPQACGLFHRSELVRVLPAHRACRPTEPLAQLEIVELRDHPVHVERDVEALVLQLVVVRQRRIEAGDLPRVARIGQTPLPQGRQGFGVRRERRALEGRDGVDVQLERITRDLGRIVTTDGAGGRVARIGEHGQALLRTPLVEAREGLARDQDLTPHLEHLRDGSLRGVQLERHVAHRAQVLGHVLADAAVTARERADQPTVLVAQRSRHPVELGFHRPDQLRAVLELQEAEDALLEVTHLLLLEQAVDREHRHFVRDLLEGLAVRQGGPHAPCRAVLGGQVRMRALELHQLAEQCVVLGVRDRRRGLDVVEAFVSAELRGQLGDACGGIGHGVRSRAVDESR